MTLEENKLNLTSTVEKIIKTANDSSAVFGISEGARKSYMLGVIFTLDALYMITNKERDILIDEYC